MRKNHKITKKLLFLFKRKNLFKTASNYLLYNFFYNSIKYSLYVFTIATIE